MYAIFFTFLLFFLLLFVMDKKKHRFLEGAANQNDTYQSYSGNDPMILAQKNAANIEYLQERLKELQSLEKNFTSLQTDVKDNKSAINQMSQIAAQHLTQVTGIPSSGPPAAVTALSSLANEPGNTPNSSTTTMTN